MTVSDNAITGTLHYVKNYTGFSSETAFQKGNYIALHWSDPQNGVNFLEVGLQPSYNADGSEKAPGEGLVECFEDDERNGVFIITNKARQKFVIKQTKDNEVKVQEFDLSGLTLEPDQE